MKERNASPNSPSSELFSAVRKGVLLGLAALALVLPPSLWNGGGKTPPAVLISSVADKQVAGESSASSSVLVPQTGPQAPVSAQTPPPAAAASPAQIPHAKPASPEPVAARKLPVFGKAKASADVRHVANWAFYSSDHEGKSVVVVDKRNAKVFVFSPEGALISTTAALLGSAIGDHTVPGVGDKPLSQVTPEERTTPAGRFIAERGMNTNGEDVVWVDYDAAVSMHRVRPNVKAERRLERLASPTPADNRISFGCINLPVAFYEKVLSPTVAKSGAVIYVLPEVLSVQAVFGSFDLPPSAQYAQR